MAYQPLTDREVYELFRTMSQPTDLPVMVDDNPSTTHFTFSIELYARIAALPGITSIKIPGVPAEPTRAREHVTRTRAIQQNRETDALQESQRLAPLWALFSEFGGSLRVTAAIAEHLNVVPNKSLPLPIHSLSNTQRARVVRVVDELGLAT